MAGGGGGATISGADSPRGPRGSESKSNSSSLETTDWPKRDPVGRRRELIGEERGVVVVRGGGRLIEGFCCNVERLDGTEGCGDVEPNKLEPDSINELSEKDVYHAWV